MFLLIHKDFLPAGGSSHVYIGILAENLERLNSIVGERRICKIKFHRGVEFKFASEFSVVFSHKIAKIS